MLGGGFFAKKLKKIKNFKFFYIFYVCTFIFCPINYTIYINKADGIYGFLHSVYKFIEAGDKGAARFFPAWKSGRWSHS